MMTMSWLTMKVTSTVVAERRRRVAIIGDMNRGSCRYCMDIRLTKEKRFATNMAASDVRRSVNVGAEGKRGIAVDGRLKC